MASSPSPSSKSSREATVVAEPALPLRLAAPLPSTTVAAAPSPWADLPPPPPEAVAALRKKAAEDHNNRQRGFKIFLAEEIEAEKEYLGGSKGREAEKKARLVWLQLDPVALGGYMERGAAVGGPRPKKEDRKLSRAQLAGIRKKKTKESSGVKQVTKKKRMQEELEKLLEEEEEEEEEKAVERARKKAAEIPGAKASWYLREALWKRLGEEEDGEEEGWGNGD